MSNTKSWMVGMRYMRDIRYIIQLGIFKLDKSYPKEKVLPEDGLYRYLYQPGEQHGDKKRWATNFIWSKKAYKLHRAIKDPDNRVLYFLQDEYGRAFVHKGLMDIPEDTEIRI